jgi:hypothetical protein
MKLARGSYQLKTPVVRSLIILFHLVVIFQLASFQSMQRTLLFEIYQIKIVHINQFAYLLPNYYLDRLEPWYDL